MCVCLRVCACCSHVRSRQAIECIEAETGIFCYHRTIDLYGVRVCVETTALTTWQQPQGIDSDVTYHSSCLPALLPGYILRLSLKFWH